jgi:5-methylcytosine-specific restriction endonuclease McrA
VHLSDDAPPLLEGAGPISPETAERLACDARRLALRPHERDLVHSRVARCASYPQLRALHKRALHCQYPGCTATYHLDAHHMTPYEHGGETVLANLILLCTRHHTFVHDHHIRATGRAEKPTFHGASGRTLTTNEPHAPP